MTLSPVLADFLRRLTAERTREYVGPRVTDADIEEFRKTLSYLQRCIEAALNQPASLGLVGQLSEVCTRVILERGFASHIEVTTSFDAEAGQLTAHVGHCSDFGAALLDACALRIKRGTRR